MKWQPNNVVLSPRGLDWVSAEAEGGKAGDVAIRSVL